MPKIERGTEVFQLQADAAFNQANPVSGTLYEWKDEATGVALGTQKNVRIISIIGKVTWATTQPTPLDIVTTVDGQTLIFRKVDPVNEQVNNAVWSNTEDPTLKLMDVTAPINRSFLLEGRSVKVEVRITWATTQPTPLTVRVKWAKIP